MINLLQIGISKFPVLLFYTSESQNSMKSGFSKPQNSVFIHLLIPKCFNEYKNNYGNVSATYYLFHISAFWKPEQIRISDTTISPHKKNMLFLSSGSPPQKKQKTSSSPSVFNTNLQWNIYKPHYFCKI